MTDSSSDSDSYSQRDEMAAMAGELMEAKMLLFKLLQVIHSKIIKKL